MMLPRNYLGNPVLLLTVVTEQAPHTLPLGTVCPRSERCMAEWDGAHETLDGVTDVSPDSDAACMVLAAALQVALAVRSKIQESSVDPNVAEEMELRDECLRHKILWKGPVAKNHLEFNCLAKVPAYDVDFGWGPPSLCLPSALGDSALTFPAPGRDGGTVAFLFPRLSAKLTKGLASDKWMARLHAYAVGA